METRAHHVIIGLFTLLVFSGALLFSLWLNNADSSEQQRYYDIVFHEPVSGLSAGSPVQYNGIQVGDVVGLKLDNTDLSKVWARIRITSLTPIKEDTRAGLALAGITGTSYIQLSHGTAASAELISDGDRIPIITATPSSLSKLLNNSQDLMSNINEAVNRLNTLLSEKNIGHLDNTLANIDRITSALASLDGELGSTLRNLSQASANLNALSAEANRRVGPLFDNADGALSSLNQSSAQIRTLLRNNAKAINGGLQGFNEIGPTLRELRGTLQRINNITRHLEEDPAGYLLEREQRKEYTPK